MSGESIEEMRLLFQIEDGGASPTSPLQLSDFKIFPCKWRDIVNVLRDFHYRKTQIGGSLKYVFKVVSNDQVIGGLAFGNPWHPESYEEGGRWKCLELRRLCLIDDAPKNSESWAIGYCLRWLRKFTDYNRILSYSDLGQGHIGTIYKASGFTLFSESKKGGKVIEWRKKNYHIRSLTIDRNYAKQLNLAVEKGEAQVIETGGKRLWIKDIGKPRKKDQQKCFHETTKVLGSPKLF